MQFVTTCLLSCLFFGALGRDRVIAALPSNIEVRLPTDLLGLAMVRFPTNRPDKNLQAALGPAATAIISKLSSVPSNDVFPFPHELSLPLVAVSDSMGRRQRMLLEWVARYGRVNHALLLRLMPTFTEPELHYRLECLRLLSFVQRVKGTPANPRSLEYELHPKYLAERAALGLDPRQADTSFGPLGDEHPNPLTAYSSDVPPASSQGCDEVEREDDSTPPSDALYLPKEGP
jgi:hypothetical protein